MNLLEILFWLLAGVLLVLPLLVFVRRRRLTGCVRVLGIGLVIASTIYVGFALFQAAPGWMGIEVTGVALYGACYVLATRYSALWLAAGWALHPLWDICLHLLGPGHDIAPAWYTLVCFSFDLIVAAYILYRVRKGRVEAGQVGGY